MTGPHVMSRATVLAALPLALALLPACGGGGSGGPAPFESIAACTGTWAVVAQPSGVGSALLYRDGTLYYEPISDAGGGTAGTPILAQPTAGDAPTIITTVPPSIFGSVYLAGDLWLDGDDIAYTQGDQENQLYGVPLAGGDPQLLVDGGAGRTDAMNARFHDLTATDFAWVETDDLFSGESAVWTASRAGGAPVRLGAISGEPLGAAAIAIVGDEVVVPTNHGTTFVFPLDPSGGAAPRMLATRDDVMAGDAHFAGVSAAGSFWLIPKPSAPDSGVNVVALSPIDGSAVQTFWAGLPAHAGADRLWADGDGGWIAIGSEAFAEGFFAEVWAIDAQGNGRRLGCQQADQLEAVIAARPAIAPDAVYLFATDTTGSMNAIARVAR